MLYYSIWYYSLYIYIYICGIWDVPLPGQVWLPESDWSSGNMHRSGPSQVTLALDSLQVPQLMWSAKPPGGTPVAQDGPRHGRFIEIEHLGMGQNPVPLVNIKIAGKWMFIPLKMVLIGIDPYPPVISSYPRRSHAGTCPGPVWRTLLHDFRLWGAARRGPLQFLQMPLCLWVHCYPNDFTQNQASNSRSMKKSG